MALSLEQLGVIILWGLWCALHSALIARPVTGYLKERLADKYRFYRLLFNLFAATTVLPLAYYTLVLDGQYFFRWEGAWRILKYLLLAGSLGLFLAGARQYNVAKFMGLEQLSRTTAAPALCARETFASAGILSVIRHPWYAGGILIIWSRDISLFSLLLHILISTYFVIGAFLEERKLVYEFGDSYRQYQKRVSMFWPWKWIKIHLSRPVGAAR
jgi:protein-S-isoprenylcysteine O-methyltransferase Ste14